MENRFEPYLFARGFCITDAPVASLPSHYSTFELGSRFVATDRRTNHGLAKSSTQPDIFVCVIGYALNAQRDTDDLQSISACLLEALTVSEVRFFSELDQLSGRFVVFYRLHGRDSILGDACATRTIFYSRQGTFVVASHFAIAQSVAGQGPSEHAQLRTNNPKRPKGKGYPGIQTPDKNIALLTANTLLRISTRTVERFYPREALPAMEVGAAVSFIKDHFHRQLQVLSRAHRVCVSLTAGLDSRTTLSATRPWHNEVIYFTYDFNDTHKIDARMAREICGKFALAFKLIQGKRTSQADFAAFQVIRNTNSYLTHEKNILEYLYAFPSRSVHIRSNLYEIARVFWKRRPIETAPVSSHRMTVRYLQRNPEEDEKHIEAGFREFKDLTAFDDNLFNYDSLDLFYWEHRMSAWHSLVLLEHDPMFDTYLLFNNRPCIRAALGVPYEQRLSGAVFKEMITQGWPELNQWPINPEVYPPPKKKAST